MLPIPFPFTTGTLLSLIHQFYEGQFYGSKINIENVIRSLPAVPNKSLAGGRCLDPICAYGNFGSSSLVAVKYNRINPQHSSVILSNVTKIVLCNGNWLIEMPFCVCLIFPDGKLMGPTWGSTGSCRPQVGPMNFAIKDFLYQFGTDQGWLYHYGRGICINEYGMTNRAVYSAMVRKHWYYTDLKTIFFPKLKPLEKYSSRTVRWQVLNWPADVSVRLSPADASTWQQVFDISFDYHFW